MAVLVSMRQVESLRHYYYYLDELMSTWITGILLGQNIVMAQSDGNEDEKMWMRKKNNKKAYLEPDLRMFTG